MFNRLSCNIGPKQGLPRGFVEKIHPDAFRSVLASKPDVRCLRNHDPDNLLGRTKAGTLRLWMDSRGLGYECNVPLDTECGRSTCESIRRGDMDGSSFSFTVADGAEEWDTSTDPPTRTVLEVRDLFDVGPVWMPAYLDATAGLRAGSSDERPASCGNAANLQRVRMLKLKLGQPIF